MRMVFGVRHVDAVFNDGGGEEDVELVIDKIEDDFLKFGGFHLPVADHDAGIGHVFTNEVLDVGELRDAVRDDIDLAVAAELEIDGVGDDLMTEGVNFGANGVTVGRRGIDDAEIARAHQRELEGARDGRRGHGERVDVDLELTQTFFDGHAEFLLFVDDEQAEIFELDGFPDEFVRTNEDIDIPLGEIFEQGFRLRRGAGSGEVVDTHGEVLQPLGEGLVMLERQDGGGHHDGDLLAVGGGFEGGANGDFSFAEADIATYQTIHGARLLHVSFHLTRDAQLVGRVLISEGGFELVLQETVGREGKSAFGTTTAVEEDEIAGNVFEFLLGAFFESLPCAGAQVRKTRRRTFFSLVLRDFVERVDRYENSVVVLILDLDDFLHRAVAAGNAHETDKLPHPVVDVNHVVAGLKLADFLEGERHFCVPRVVGTQIVFVEAVEDLMIGVERGADRRVAETFVQSEVDGREKCALDLLTGGLHQLGEDVAQTLLLLLAVGQDESALSAGEIFDKGVQHLLKVLVEQWLRLGVKDDGRHFLAAGDRLCARTAHPLPENGPFQLRLQLFSTYQQTRGGKTCIDFRELHLGGGGLLGECLLGKTFVEDLLHAIAHKTEIVRHDDGALRQIVGEGNEQLAFFFDFDVGNNHGLGHNGTRQLRLHLERVDTLDLIAEEVDAIGVFRRKTEDVENRTAQGVFARLVNIVFALETQFFQTAREFDDIVRFAHFQRDAPFGEGTARGNAFRQRRGEGHNEERLLTDGRTLRG